MESLSSFETLSRQYLLGELTEADLAAMQQEIFSDQEKFYQLCEIEDGLLDEYARGALSAEQRRRFEHRYLSNPTRKRRVEFAQAMAREFQRADHEVPTPPSFFRRAQAAWQQMLTGLRASKLAVSAAAAVIVLLLVGTAWLLIERAGLYQKVAKLEANQQPSATPTVVPDSAATPLSTSSGPTRPAHDTRVVNLTVFALALRSETPGKGTELILPPDVEQIRLHIQLPVQHYHRYAVRLQDAGEQEVFTQRELKAVKGKPGHTVVVTIPALRLHTGTHLLTLDGLSDNGEREPVSKLEIHVTRK